MNDGAKSHDERSVAALMKREMSPAESYLIIRGDAGAERRTGRTPR